MPEDQGQGRNPDGPPLDQRVSFRISRLNARLNAQAARILADSAAISLSQWRVMVMIEREGAITASDIVRKTKIDKALISRTIKAMIDQGLVATDVDAEDQRAHPIRFTAKGRQRFEEAWPHMLARHNGLVAGLDPQERDLFFAALTKIEQAIDAMDEGA